MKEQQFSRHFLLNFEKSAQFLPELLAASRALDGHLHSYQEAARRFDRHFLALWSGRGLPVAEETKALIGLAEIRQLVANQHHLAEPLQQLERHNQRAALACDLLGMVLRGI